MSEARDMFALLRQSADGKAVDAIERLVAEGRDHQLCRVNPLAFAARNGLDDEATIAAFLHATRIGMFDIAWNVLCPGCGGDLTCGDFVNASIAEQRGHGVQNQLPGLCHLTLTQDRGVRLAHRPLRCLVHRSHRSHFGIYPS